MSSKTQSSRSLWLMVGAGAIILMVTMGVRNSLGLYIQPISQSTPVNIASISLALAVGQFLWGAIQPIAGALADRYGSRPILLIGMVILILGLLIAPMWTSSFGLMMSLGVLSAIGSGIGSFSVLMGCGGATHHAANARQCHGNFERGRLVWASGVFAANPNAD